MFDLCTTINRSSIAKYLSVPLILTEFFIELNSCKYLNGVFIVTNCMVEMFSKKRIKCCSKAVNRWLLTVLTL